MKRGMAWFAGMWLMASGVALWAQGTPGVPAYNKIVVLMLENHSFDQITGTNSVLGTPLPYVSRLINGGALMTQAYGLQHPSQPNYYWLFSGSSQGVVSDSIPITNGISQVASTSPNLATSLSSASKTFGAFVEGYETSGSTSNSYMTLTNSAGISQNGSVAYNGTTNAITNDPGVITNVARHMPWFGFSNLEAQWNDITKPFSTFPNADFSTLPDVSFVIPALEHQMHNYTFGRAVGNTNESALAMANADYWMEYGDTTANGGTSATTPMISSYASWALQNNSLLIVLTDEDSSADWDTPGVSPANGTNYFVPDNFPITSTNVPPGFTSPDLGPSDTADFASGQPQTGPNQIFALFYGANVMPGAYSNGITSVNVLRTIEASMGLNNVLGAQPEWMLTNGAVPMNDLPITSIFVPEARTCLLLTLSFVVMAGFRTLAARFKKPTSAMVAAAGESKPSS